MNKKILTIAGLFIVNSVFATDNMPPTICDHEGLMQCLNITNKDCTQSMNLSLELCTSNIDISDDSYEVGELAKKLTPCLSVQFLNQSGLTPSSMEICNKEFNNANITTLRWLEKKTQEDGDRFFNEDDPLHSYRK